MDYYSMGLQKMIYDSFISSQKFSDIENFPYGIEKNHNFTQMEADVLMRCGVKMMQLFNGELVPENEDQKRFIEVAKGQIKPLYHVEFVFLKYLSISEAKNKIA